MGITKFTEAFHWKNFSVFIPRKDQCDVCVAHDTGNINDEQFRTHRRKVKRARKHKNRDEKRSETDQSTSVFTMDLQKVLLAPRTNASEMYYKTKIIVHNYVYYQKRTKYAKCFFGDQTEGDVKGPTFASLHYKQLRLHLSKNPEVDRIILWADGCAAQTKNKDIGNLLLHLAVNKNVTIEQKYFVPGHSQMECDTLHAKIEKKIKKQPIFHPADYAAAAKAVRKSQPVNVKTLVHTDFKKLTGQYVASLRPGQNIMRDVVAYRYNPTEPHIQFKLSHSDDWQDLPQRITIPDELYEQVPLFTQRLPVSRKKKEDCLALLSVIPADNHQYYHNLPTELYG